MKANELQSRAAADEGILRGWSQFWFTPTPAVGLHVLRVGAGLLFLFWLLPFMNHLDSLFGLNGWFDEQAYAKALEKPTAEQRDPENPENRGMLDPLIGWSLLYARAIGGSSSALAVVYWLSLLIFVLFTLGVAPRLTSVLTWLAVVSFTANPALTYDGDSYLLVLAFYLMVGYVLIDQRSHFQGWYERVVGSMDHSLFRVFRPRPGAESRPSLGANLALRLLQIHLAIIMLSSGLHKLQFGDWWGGYALWYALYPAGQVTLEQARAHAGNGESARTYLFFLSAGAYAVLFWQIAFPLFAWRRAWRPVLLVGGLIGWWADSFLYDLPLMGPALFLGCLAFITAEEWQRLFAWLPGLPGLHWLPAPSHDSDSDTNIPTSKVAKESLSPCIPVGHP